MAHGIKDVAGCRSLPVPWKSESNPNPSESSKYFRRDSHDYLPDELGRRHGGVAQPILDHGSLNHGPRDVGDYKTWSNSNDGFESRTIGQREASLRRTSAVHRTPAANSHEHFNSSYNYGNQREHSGDTGLHDLAPNAYLSTQTLDRNNRGRIEANVSASGSNPFSAMPNNFQPNLPQKFVKMTESNERAQIHQPKSKGKRDGYRSNRASARSGPSSTDNFPTTAYDKGQYMDPAAQSRTSFSQRDQKYDVSSSHKRQRIDQGLKTPTSFISSRDPQDIITAMPHVAAAQALMSMHEYRGEKQEPRSVAMTPTSMSTVPELTPGSTYRSISFSPGPPTPLDQKRFSAQKQLLSPIPTPELSTRHSNVEDINREQRELLRDARVMKQLDWFKRVKDTQPPTHYSGLAPIGIHIIEAGQAAQTSDIVESADYLLGDSKKLEFWLTNGTGDKLFVLRDPDWLHTRPQTYSSTMLKDLRTTSGKGLEIEVQLLEKVHIEGENSVTSMPIDSILDRFADQSQNFPPINLLSLMCSDDGTVPWPLAKHCNLLNQAAAYSASTAHANFIAEKTATAGKHSTEIMSRFVDLQACIHFQIFGQAGAISSWHIDSIGPYTYITLEPSAPGAPARDVLKLWAYIRTDHLSIEEQNQVRKDFALQGGGYKPDPKLIRILSLVAGDTLIMPPGTIHSPITITDCLFRGGMVMQKKFMRRSVQEWRFCSDNGDCTNEEQPKQSRSVLDYFRHQVLADPESCGYDSGSIPEFLDSWRAISSACMKCNCKSGCHKDSRCGCMRNSQRCGGHCHKKDTKCLNPHGCEADVTVEVKVEVTIESEADVLVKS